MIGINQQAFKYSTFPQFLTFFNGPRPFKQHKTVSSSKQLNLGQVSIMWRPLQKTLAVCPKFDFKQYRYATTTAVDSVSVWGIPPILKQNSQDHAQKPKQNCTFMNSSSEIDKGRAIYAKKDLFIGIDLSINKQGHE
jgi:hypothetical protein